MWLQTDQMSLKEPQKMISIREKHVCFGGNNNNLFVGEDDEGSCLTLHPPSTLEVFKRLGLLTIDFSFIVFIFHSDVILDEITVLQGCLIENLQLLSVSGSSPEDPRGLQARQPGDPVPSDT